MVPTCTPVNQLKSSRLAFSWFFVFKVDVDFLSDFGSILALKIGQDRFLETSWKRLWRVLGLLRVVSVRLWASWSVLEVSGSLWVASWGVLGRHRRPWEGLRGFQNSPKKWDPAGVCRNLLFAFKLDAKRNDFGKF